MLLKKYNIQGHPTTGGLAVWIVLLLALMSCKPAPPFTLHQAWISGGLRTPGGVTLGQERLIHLYPNGVYTLFSNYSGYDIGYWQAAANGEYLILKPKKQQVDPIEKYWKYKQTGNNTMEVQVYNRPDMLQGTEEGTYTFTGYPATEDNDPFSPEANRWRIPPAQPESLEDIRQRVLDFLVFQRNWYAFVLQHKMDPILINWYPNPMLMHYANGVRMAYADELDSWNRCFYDSTAAVRGYQFIGGGLREVTIKKTDNKVERNLDCLKQMIDAIRTQEILKEPTPEATTN